MHHGIESGLARLRRPVAMLGAASLALVLGGTALLVPTVTVAKVASGCVKKCDRTLASSLAFCARTAESDSGGTPPATDGIPSVCEEAAAEAHDACLTACGAPGDPY